MDDGPIPNQLPLHPEGLPRVLFPRMSSLMHMCCRCVVCVLKMALPFSRCSSPLILLVRAEYCSLSPPSSFVFSSSYYLSSCVWYMPSARDIALCLYSSSDCLFAASRGLLLIFVVQVCNSIVQCCSPSVFWCLLMVVSRMLERVTGFNSHD